MFWVFGFGRVLACWFRPNISFDRKGHILRCYLQVNCFGFSGLLACSHAGFAQTGPSLENNGSLTKHQKWDLDNLSTESGHRAC